ncbi:ribonuclease HIII [Streptococcus orisratti]|uniref:ribonuclease HIII n=1 Tax=Streptococcus orisratti TaxID=114652 RepID=UPI00294352EE|nr:ribonuclease HIII [Streptococcus orisratti]
MTAIVMTLGQGRTTDIPQELSRFQVSSNNPYVSFAAKTREASVLIYTSGKVVFQGTGASVLASQFGYQDIWENSKAKSPAGQNLTLIGSDEVGNGSYFGGLAVVASFVTPDEHAWLKKLGVDDSKNLNDIEIRQLAPVLEEKIPHKALLLSPQKYNQVVGKGKRHNAVSVKVALHNQAIYLLLREVARPDKIVIDAFTSQKNYEKYVKAETNHFDNPLTFEEKAEGKYLAVAVSSIIARNLFLENLDKLGQETGFILPSGAGNKSDKVASQILAAYGMSGLEHTAKLHFANTQKAQALLKK